MFRLYCRKNKNIIKPQPGAEKIALFIVKALLKLQTAWARWLKEKEKKMTTRRKKQALVIFCLSMFAIVVFLTRGVWDDNHSFLWLKPPEVTFPQDSRLPDSINLKYLRELLKHHKAQKLDSLNLLK